MARLTVGTSSKQMLSLKPCFLGIVIVLYLLCINTALFYIVYHPHNKSIMTASKNSIVDALFTPRTLTHPQHDATKFETKQQCLTNADLFIAVVPDAQADNLYSRAAIQYTRLFGELRRSTNNIKLYILIIVTLDTFHPEHRKICRSMDFCSLVVVEDTKHNTIMNACQGKKICTEHVILLSDVIHTDLSFVNRLRLLPKHQVSCMLPPQGVESSSIHNMIHNAAGTTVHGICPVLALCVPLNVTLSSNDMSIVEYAISHNIYAGGFPVVSIV